MKRIIRTCAMVAALLSSTLNFANDVSHTNSEKENIDSSLFLEYGERELIIKNGKGSIIRKEAILTEGPIDLASYASVLSDGTYTFEIIGETTIEVTPFTMVEQKFHLNVADEYTIYKPILRTKNDLLLISQLSLDQQAVAIEVYFDAQDDGVRHYELLYTEIVESTMNIGRVLALDKKESGKYKVVLTTDGRSFSQQFRF